MNEKQKALLQKLKALAERGGGRGKGRSRAEAEAAHGEVWGGSVGI